MDAKYQSYVDRIKQDAFGRWPEILRALAPELSAALDAAPSRHVKCPLPEHEDQHPSFRFDNPDKGRAICNCGSYDGFSLLQGLRGWGFRQTVSEVAHHLGLGSGNGAELPLDVLQVVCLQKNIPVDGARVFGARGRGQTVAVPQYDANGKQCSTTTINPWGDTKEQKGKNASGKPAGMHLPHREDGRVRLPQPGEQWLLVESFKCAAALHSHGYLAAGMNGRQIQAPHTTLFAGCDVTIVHHLDKPAVEGARKTVGRLDCIAKSVRIARMPGEIKVSKGDDVRDVLQRSNGESLIRDAINSAQRRQPGDHAADDDNPLELLSVSAQEGRTDRANGLRFVDLHRANVRFCYAWKSWLVWDGIRWKIDNSGQAEKLAQSVSDRIWIEARETGNPAALQFAAKTADDKHVRAILNQAKPALSISHDKLDSDSWLLNCPNGTVDLRTGKLRPHCPEDMMTKLCPTCFNPEASSSLWDTTLEKIFDQSEVIDFLRRAFGYSLTGDISEQILLIFWGEGSNGKSTLLNAFMETVGPDYTMQAQPDFLVAKKRESHATERMDLFGKRLVACVETEDKHRVNESFIKMLTGGEAIRGRRVFENAWQFSPTHKVVLCTNHKPRVTGRDHAIWRRLCLVPFETCFWNPDKGETGLAHLKQDKELPAKLKAECEGILASLVRGCLEWKADGLRVPEAVSHATNEYRQQQDVEGRFVKECCCQTSGRTKFKMLYQAFEEWGKDTGESIPSRRVFSDYLKSRGFQHNSKGGTVYFHGLGVLTEDEP